jgi:hypothetical protein
MDFECPICLENTINNVEFICSHTICNTCFEKCIKYQNNNNFKCPICRRIVFSRNSYQISITPEQSRVQAICILATVLFFIFAFIVLIIIKIIGH